MDTCTQQLTVRIYFGIRDFGELSTLRNHNQILPKCQIIKSLRDPTTCTLPVIYGVDSLWDFVASRISPPGNTRVIFSQSVESLNCEIYGSHSMMGSMDEIHSILTKTYGLRTLIDDSHSPTLRSND